MKLARLSIRNFRCFADEIAIDFEDFSALIGKNDSGKSTIMEALDLFFNDKNPDKDDASKNGNAEDLTIVCEFKDLPAEVIIDEEYPTDLKTEFLLNNNGNLEVSKTYNGDLLTPKLTSVSIRAWHPSAKSLKDLLQLKNSDLKGRADDLQVDLTSVDTRINARLRKAIRDHTGDLQLTSSVIPLNKDNGSKIWDGLKKYMPVFSLFKSDRGGTDQDAEAQDPLKIAVKEAIKSKEKELESITEYVRSEVEKVAHLTLEKLKEMDSTLASQLQVNFATQKWDNLFKTSISGDDEIPINKRGSGIRRLILLNFFRAKTEQVANENDNPSVIYAIEEPETSQHPHNQRMLMRTLSNLSSEAQVIISTHTPMLARALPENSIRYINVLENKKREILKGGPATNELITKSLGILPDNTVRLFIAVEGINDIKFLQDISKMLHNVNPNIPDLEKMEIDGEVIFIPLGGSNLAHWSSRLGPLGRPEFHLYDRDVQLPEKPKYQDQVDSVNSRENCIAKITSKKEIENYIHKDAIIAAYNDSKISINIPANFETFDDVPVSVARLVYEASESTNWDQLSKYQKQKKEAKAKQVLCTKAAGLMTHNQLDEVDKSGDVTGWFTDIQHLLNP
jgi:predicted ATP-dependent endonuclease of OLD family